MMYSNSDWGAYHDYSLQDINAILCLSGDQIQTENQTRILIST